MVLELAWGLKMVGLEVILVIGRMRARIEGDKLCSGGGESFCSAHICPGNIDVGHYFL